MFLKGPKMHSNIVDLSIIIPVYNDGKTIAKIIEKILSENRIDLELIIVNDGSTDNTGEILQLFDDKRLHILTQNNLGVYAARNAALKLHKGRWIIFLDADDDFKNDMLYQRVKLIEEKNVDVLITNGFFTHLGNNTSGRRIHSHQLYNKVITGHKWLSFSVNNNEWPHYLWLQIVSSNYIKQHNLTFNSGHSHQDILWSAMLALKNGIFFISDHCDYSYFINPQSITNSNKYFDRRALNYIEVISKLISYATEYPDLRKELLKHAVYECRHFIGLYRKKVSNKRNVSEIFFNKINYYSLWRGASTLKQYWLLIRLYRELKYCH